MPARFALGVLAPWEMPLAIALTLAAIVGMARLAVRVYAPAVLRGGPRVGWRAAMSLDRDGGAQARTPVRL